MKKDKGIEFECTLKVDGNFSTKVTIPIGIMRRYNLEVGESVLVRIEKKGA